jgi:hypothetical protein
MLSRISRHLRVLVVAATIAGCGGRLTVERLQDARQGLLQKAFAANSFDPDRQVTHVSHVCSLRLDRQWFPVLDIQEIVKGEVVPRGANSIVVLDSEFKLTMRLPYATERPLFCHDNRLYVWGDLQVEETASEGNELTFTEHARHLTVRHVEANDVPALSGKASPEQ